MAAAGAGDAGETEEEERWEGEGTDGGEESSGALEGSEAKRRRGGTASFISTRADVRARMHMATARPHAWKSQP